jgi:hypothetical protein
MKAISLINYIQQMITEALVLMLDESSILYLKLSNILKDARQISLIFKFSFAI